LGTYPLSLITSFVNVGDQITFKATCLNINKETYVFAISDIPYNDSFNIPLSQTDETYNQRIHEALDKLKEHVG
jgi:hypothetical protein